MCQRVKWSVTFEFISCQRLLVKDVRGTCNVKSESCRFLNYYALPSTTSRNMFQPTPVYEINRIRDETEPKIEACDKRHIECCHQDWHDSNKSLFSQKQHQNDLKNTPNTFYHIIVRGYRPIGRSCKKYEYDSLLHYTIARVRP